MSDTKGHVGWTLRPGDLEPEFELGQRVSGRDDSSYSSHTGTVTAVEIAATYKGGAPREYRYTIKDETTGRLVTLRIGSELATPDLGLRAGDEIEATTASTHPRTVRLVLDREPWLSRRPDKMVVTDGHGPLVVLADSVRKVGP